jgi:Holliday junction resolvasome RuvABC endonuclease subunit
VSWVWGIDPSVLRLAFAFCEVGGRRIAWRSMVNPKADARGAERLAELEALTYTATRLFAREYPPRLVMVEQPAGRSRSPETYFAAGVMEAASYSALANMYDTPVEFRRIVPPSWKLAALGKGNADKKEIAAWAKRHGCEGTQDVADALGIAVAGRSAIENLLMD